MYAILVLSGIADQPLGGKCGATSVDRNLHWLMHQRFGVAWDEIEMRRKGPGSRFMSAWESVKRGFGSHSDSQVREIGPLNLRNVGSSHFYDSNESMVLLTRCDDNPGSPKSPLTQVCRDDIESLFTPVVNDILRMVADQRMAILHRGCDVHVSDCSFLLGRSSD